VAGFGRRRSLDKGAELGRASKAGVPFKVGWISPAAVDTLFVNDEMAHPVHEAGSLGCGVLIRGAAVVDAPAALRGGNAVSAIDDANLRTRWR
jgi:hypothetical protein